MEKSKIINLNINVIKKNDVINLINNWLSIEWEERKSKSIFLSNVHMCMEAKDDFNYCNIVNESSLVLPDGKPVYIAQRLFGYYNAEHIRGEDLMLNVCQLASDKNYRIGLFGSTKIVLFKLKEKLSRQFPKLEINFTESPPFRQLTKEENKIYNNKINENKIDILFVSLGCPKQEIWINNCLKDNNSIMIGVGAAFEFISGTKKNAPKWIQNIGFEWLYRLISEPKRLWKRYLKHNPRFLWYIIIRLLRIKK